MISEVNSIFQAPPKASAMLESLRGVGYSVETALADIVDNSIAAGADNIDINFYWGDTGSYICIADNGCGMADQELFSAMRLGEISPEKPRSSIDLGRFGMGLKTASFSQCRKLTVGSKKNGIVSHYCWDLDLIARRNDGNWYMVKLGTFQEDSRFEDLQGRESGTIVLWEALDKIVTTGFSEKNYLNLIDDVEKHVAMIFHRFIEAGQIKIKINGKIIKPWDPYLVNHPLTWKSPVEKINHGAFFTEVQAFVLPHKDKIGNDLFEKAGGINGWVAHQGFFVYRNQRLLVAGSWLGLGDCKPWVKEEFYRMVRIRLDISSLADGDWQIDIKKSRAKPPVFLKNGLTKIAIDARNRAKKVFAWRGNPELDSSGQNVCPVWLARNLSDGPRYSINAEHPIVKELLNYNDANVSESFCHFLKLVAATVPVQRIWLDTQENKEVSQKQLSSSIDKKELENMMKCILRSMVEKKGYSLEVARNHLEKLEPFNLYPDLIEKINI